jgi:CubicO group peptidase (beta-lactamase class C family)
MKGFIHEGEVDITPEEAGYRTETLEKLNALLDSLVESGRLAGASYMMSRGGRVFANRAAGRLRLTPDSPPFTTQSIRRIASITKLFTAACILRLVEEGRLWLNQPVADWIPEFRERPFDKITLFHLLTHTSGLRPDPGYFLEPYPVYWRDWEFAFDEEANSGEARDGTAGGEGGPNFRRRSPWIKSLLAGSLRHEPGAEWHYCTAGFALLGQVIRRATGKPYEEVFQEKIFDPLGLSRTFFNVPDELKDQVCIINEWEEERLHYRVGPDGMPSTGGGIFSTLGDLHRFGLVLMNMGSWDGVRILGRKTVELMRRDQFPDGIYAYHWGENTQNFHIGLGATIGRTGEPFRGTAFGHEGAGRCMMLADPEEQFVAVYFVPSNEDWLPESIINVRTMMWAGLK